MSDPSGFQFYPVSGMSEPDFERIRSAVLVVLRENHVRIDCGEDCTPLVCWLDDTGRARYRPLYDEDTPSTPPHP